jgi:hypothetical protein
MRPGSQHNHRPLPGLLKTFESQTLAQRLAALFAPVYSFIESLPVPPRLPQWWSLSSVCL